MIDLDKVWASSDELSGPRLDDELLARCEGKYGVKFPNSFVRVYKQRNGGVLRDCDWPDHLFPLADDDTANFGMCIRPLSSYAQRGEILSDDMLEWVEEDYGDPQLIFPLWTDGHVVYALNFNDAGSQQEPSVDYFDFECVSHEQIAANFEQWLASLFGSDDVPLVDWDKRNEYFVVAEETVEIEYPGQGRETFEQVLSREDDEIVLFTRHTYEDGRQELAQVSIDGGVDPSTTSVRGYRPAPINTFVLHLQPSELDDIQWVTARRGSDGKWNNEQTRGVPIYCTFETTDRAKLEQLRSRLLGGKVPKSVVAEEELQERFADMSPEQQSSAFAKQMLAGLESLDAMMADEDLGPIPEDLAPALENLQRMKEQMVQELSKRGADNPLDPNVMDLIKDAFAQSAEMVDATVPRESAKDNSPVAAAQPAEYELSDDQEALLTEYEALVAEFAEELKSVIDEPTARAAFDRLNARATEMNKLRTKVEKQFQLQDGLRPDPIAAQVTPRIMEGFMALHQELYRIQHSIPDAEQLVQQFSYRLNNPDAAGSEKQAQVGRGQLKKAAERMHLLLREMSTALPKVTDAKAAREALDRFILRLDELDNLYQNQLVPALLNWQEERNGLVPQSWFDTREKVQGEVERIMREYPEAGDVMNEFVRRFIAFEMRYSELCGVVN